MAKSSNYGRRRTNRAVNRSTHAIMSARSYLQQGRVIISTDPIFEKERESIDALFPLLDALTIELLKKKRS